MVAAGLVWLAQRNSKTDPPTDGAAHARVGARTSVLPGPDDDAGLVTGADHAAGSTACTCDAAKLRGGWCEACKVGYVAGLAIPSHLLYETLDNHGHDIPPAMALCPTCKTAIATDGFCEACRVGYIAGRLYVTPLTYWLAKGEAEGRGRVTCPKCRGNPKDGAWCEACGVGRVGNVAIRDRAGFEWASREFSRLELAITRLAGCKWCAVATYSNGMCPFCRISYQDGKATQP